MDQVDSLDLAKLLPLQLQSLNRINAIVNQLHHLDRTGDDLKCGIIDHQDESKGSADRTDRVEGHFQSLLAFFSEAAHVSLNY